MSWEPPSTVPTCSHGSPLNEFCVDCDGVKIVRDCQIGNSPATSELKLKDSGTRQEFSTGAVRDAQSAKGRFDLIPFWPIFAYASVLEIGAKKYAAKNWQKGMPMSRYIDSAQRHLYKYMSGMRDEPHLWQAFWNLAGAIHTQINVYLGVYPTEFNDMTDDTGKPTDCLSQAEKDRIEATRAVPSI